MITAKNGKSLMHGTESGYFGEALIRLELSRAGWPVVLSAQGVGIDILAVARDRRRVAISVKCRDRSFGGLHTGTTMFRNKPGKRTATVEVERFKEICDLLGAEPWVGVVTISPGFTYVHLAPIQHYEKAYATEAAHKVWATSAIALGRYAADSQILGNKKPGTPGSWELAVR